MVVSKSNNQANCDLPSQIYAHQLSNQATNHTNVPYGHSWEKPKNSISIGSSTCLYVQSLAPNLTPCVAKDSWLTNRIMGTCTTIKALSFADWCNLRIWSSYNLTCSLTHLLNFWSCLHVSKDTAHVYTCRWTNADATWHHLMTSLGYVSRHAVLPHIPSLCHHNIIIQSFDMSSRWC